MSFRTGFRRLAVTFFLAHLAWMPVVTAQESEATGYGDVEIAAGDILEFIGVSSEATPSFDWVLTKNGTFVEAGRSRIFRARLIETGSYVLEGQSHGGTGIARVHVDVRVTERGDFAPEEDTGLDIVSTDLPIGQGGIRVSPDRPLLTLIPSPALPAVISADLDTQTDTDGDGISGNDNDVGDTLFATEHNPLRLWFSTPERSTSLRLSVTAEDGTPVTQEIAVTSGSAPVPEGSIVASAENEASVDFSLSVDEGFDTSSVVYLWNFGDGRESMEEAPRHRYLNNGEYAVQVTVRDMATGRVVTEGSMTVTIVGIPPAAESPAASSSSSSVAVPSSGTTSGSSLTWTILKILLVLLGAILLGGFAVWGFTTFMKRESSLQKTLEEAEGKLLKTDGSAASDAAPATMKLKRSEAPVDVAPVEPVAEEKQAEAPAAPEPIPAADAAKAPAWLQKGLAAAKEEEESPPSPAESSQTSPSVPENTSLESAVSAPAPASESTPVLSEPPTLSEDDLLPPWLKEDQSGPQPESITPVTPISPEPAPAVSAPAEPSPAPVEPIVPEPIVSKPAVPEPEPVPPALPADVTEPQPQTSEPVSPETVTVAATPTPVAENPLPEPTPPIPEPETPTSEPVTVKPLPPPPSPLPSVAETPLPQKSGVRTAPPPDSEHAERERERKRRKRQRYRENLKKRKSEGTPAPSASKEPETPAPSLSKPITPVSDTPASVSKPETPVLETSSSAPDDQVAFVIKAEGIEKKPAKEKKNGKKDSGTEKKAA